MTDHWHVHQIGLLSIKDKPAFVPALATRSVVDAGGGQGGLTIGRATLAATREDITPSASRKPVVRPTGASAMSGERSEGPEEPQGGDAVGSFRALGGLFEYGKGALGPA